MCGFVLVVERGREIDWPRLREAGRSIKHRGPDSTGEAAVALPALGRAPALAVGVVFNRLSILDPRSRSDQPFRRGPHTLAYNGEIYNFRDLRTDLALRGERFETDGDTEVLLALLASAGLTALPRLNGMWAFAWLDERARTLTAARDRYGKKPLYHTFDERRLVIASEIMPILRYEGRRGVMLGPPIETFLAHGWLFPGPGPATHFDGIRQTPPGGTLTADLTAWTLAAGSGATVAQALAADRPRSSELPDVIESAVHARLVSDRRIGLLLSGGVDSSLILSVLAARGLADQVHCFTGDAGKSDDAAWARRVIDASGIRATTLPLDYGRSGFDRFLKVCRHQEKPFPLIGNVLAMPQMYEAIAGEGVPVVLDGTGGDEIFGGYWDRSYPLALADAESAGDQTWIAEIHAANRDDEAISQLTDRVRTALATDPRGGVLGPVRGFVSEEGADLRALLKSDLSGVASSDPLAGWRGSFDEGLVADAGNGRLQEWLWQNDRNAMAAGVENRSPLLDHRLAPWLRSGRSAKLSGRWSKLELRRAFDAFKPLPTQWRRDKQGFRWVYGRFLRNNRKSVLELVDSARILRPYVAVPALLDRALRDDDALESDLMQRALVLAGLEIAMDLAT